MTEVKRVRRVVTGQDPEAGKSRIVSDSVIDATARATISIASIWGADEAPRFPDTGAQPRAEAFFPALGGYRFIVINFPPGAGMDVPSADPAAKPGMHKTDTVDLKVVLSGEVSLEFDSGETVTLHAGDTMIENGTNHRWFNAGAETASLAIFLLGGHERAGVKPPL
jgi:quercetin dioxygenase-like cupin family protein